LAALGLLVVPFVPWLPDHFPLLLVLAGPLRWAVVTGVVVAVAKRGMGAVGWGAISLPLPGRKTAFAVSLAVYLLAWVKSLAIIGLGGDEPHYLVIAHSLLHDRDLRIENNHKQGDYRPFFGAELRPDYLRRGLNGEIYSIHAPGLPALVLPGYAVAGSRGAVAIICLLAALAALAIFELARLVGGRSAAWGRGASIFLTRPGFSSPAAR